MSKESKALQAPSAEDSLSLRGAAHATAQHQDIQAPLPVDVEEAAAPLGAVEVENGDTVRACPSSHEPVAAQSLGELSPGLVRGPPVLLGRDVVAVVRAAEGLPPTNALFALLQEPDGIERLASKRELEAKVLMDELERRLLRLGGGPVVGVALQ